MTKGQNTSQIHLLFSLDCPRFDVAFINHQNNQCLRLESYDLGENPSEDQILGQVQNIVKTHDLLNGMFWKSVSLSINNQSFTLIPRELFKKEYASRYLLLARGTALKDTEEAHYYEHQALGANNVFSVEKKTLSLLQELYPFQDFRLLHQTSGLINIAMQYRQSNVSVFYEKDAFSLVYANNQQLQYCNRFLFKTQADFVYYVLFVLKELQIENTYAEVFLYGDIEANDLNYKELQKFVPHLTIGNNQSKVQLTNELSAHKFASVFNAFF